MRLIKAFVIGAAGLFIVMTLLSLLIPSRVRVSRTVLINNTTTGKVYTQIAVLPNWKNWHPLFSSTNASISFSADAPDESGVINYNGKLTKLLVTYSDSSSVKFLLQSDGEKELQNELVFTEISSQGNVLVTWNAYNKFSWYPWEKFYAIFIDKLTGPGYEAALNGLKTYLETTH